MSRPDIHFLFAEERAEPGILDFLDGEVVAASLRDPEKTGANEDGAFLASWPGGPGLLAVVDGMGGGPSGEKASRLVLKALEEACLNGDPDRPRDLVLSALDRANAAILELGLGAGATLALAEIHRGRMRSYHVGDAHLLLTGQRGKVRRLTIAHGPTGYAVEAGLMDEEEALFHEDRHIVSNHLGNEDMRVEMATPVGIRPRDRLLLASDGLFDNLHVEEIVQTVRCGPPRKALETLVASARTRMQRPGSGEPSKPDDLTVLLYRPRGPRLSPSRPSPAPSLQSVASS